MREVLVVLALFAVGCTSTPSTPTPVKAAPALVEMGYVINVPVLLDLQAYRAQFPNGIRLNPIAAQARWDYTKTYGGTPNVYFGQIAPPCQNYFNTGIVIAPYRVASLDTFTAADWPGGPGLDAGVTYVWTGRFTYSIPAPPGSFTYDPRCIP